ncbi:putative hexokinase HXK1 [Delitschia confertaspora ATCC 74209]|uniref:Phosphotransferase n=1 Tax=Delitschia confertaspora ATCC 74209 TaxID=1513339 RepID=A0A9P4MSG1_9PLEO|nr:putative hexokinase HXK1 [Delitschia confertaspora ATCC 74209]
MDSEKLVGHDSWRQRSELKAMADLPPELEDVLSKLDQEFWVPTEKLHSIVEHFIEEMEEGLSTGEPIPMNITWVHSLPTGDEKGTFLALDLGGTNLRVCKIDLQGNGGKHSIDQAKYKLPPELKTGNANELWNHVADALAQFMEEKKLGAEYHERNPVPLGFTFSYPATQDRIDHGVLQTWTKGFDIDGVEGHNAAAQLREAITARDLPIKLVALINDTVGAMVASAYSDPETIIGGIFGTGCNAAYMEDCKSIPKLKADLPRDSKMAINCEYGAFDNRHRVLPRTKYDEQIDEESPRPGEQTFEKLSAGLYLGEIFRLALVDLVERGLIFKDQDTAKLKKPYEIDTGFLSQIEDDESTHLTTTRDLFQSTLSLSPSEPEIELVRRLAEVIAMRGARLCACGVAAICKKKRIQKGHVAADGSVANKHPKFKKRWAEAMAEILGWEEGRMEDPIVLTSAEDGSGLGAAVIAAMELKRRGEA